MKSSRRTKKRRRWLTPGFWPLVFGGIVGVYVVAALLFILPLRWLNPPVTAFMLQQTGAAERVLKWAPLESISSDALLAVIASEDQRFLLHRGVDFAAIGKALDENRESVRGASTITQQLVKNLYLWPRRSVIRKGFEAGLALTFELLIPKRRILELYLNVVEFGPGIYGVGAASERYFSKPASRLTAAEAALLAAALPNPKLYKVSAPGDYMRNRQRWIVGQVDRLRREGFAKQLDL